MHGGSLPVNAVTGRAYSGINVPLLWMAAEEHGYTSDRWLTFRQAKAAGGYVRKNETSALAIIYKPFEKQARDSSDNLLYRDGEPVMEQLAMLKQLQLFNVAQCDGLPNPYRVNCPTRWRQNGLLSSVQRSSRYSRYSTQPASAASIAGRTARFTVRVPIAL